MKSIIFPLAFTGCTVLSAPPPSFGRGDYIEFNFKDENLFYKNSCDNKGEIVNFKRKYHYGFWIDTETNEYLTKIKCYKGFRPELIWVSEEDITRKVK